jgi:hypothetical protein
VFPYVCQAVVTHENINNWLSLSPKTLEKTLLFLKKKKQKDFYPRGCFDDPCRPMAGP